MFWKYLEQNVVFPKGLNGVNLSVKLGFQDRHFSVDDGDLANLGNSYSLVIDSCVE